MDSTRINTPKSCYEPSKQLVCNIWFYERYVCETKQDIRFNKIAIQAAADVAADKEAVVLSRVHMYESKCILCPYEILVYSVLIHINTARMHSICRQFIPLFYGPLGERIFSNMQPTLPFH